MAEFVCSSSDPAWLTERAKGVTATDITVIAGFVSWDSPWALYHRKLGHLPPVEESYRMRKGTWMQSILVNEWEGFGFRDVFDRVAADHLFRSADRPWQLATPDMAYKDAVLECKSTQVREGWGVDGSDEVPARVRAQVLWQMDVLGVASGFVAADVCGDFRSYVIRHEYSMPHPGMTESCGACSDITMYRGLGFEFYRRLTGELPPPDVDDLPVTTEALKARWAPRDEVTADIDPKWAGLYDAATAAKKEAEFDIRSIQNEVRAAMGDASVATVDGRPVFRRTTGKRAGYTVPPGTTDILRRLKDHD